MAKQKSSGSSGKPKNLSELLDYIGDAAREHDPVTLGDIMDAVGRRSFGPL